MYSIYTLMYGIEIPNELSEKIQESELEDVIYYRDDSGFICNIPYSGDDQADIHLGFVIDTTEGCHKLSKFEPAEEMKEKFPEMLPKLKDHLVKNFDEFVELNSDSDYYPVINEDKELFNEFVKMLDSEPKVYTAYSTS